MSKDELEKRLSEIINETCVFARNMSTDYHTILTAHRQIEDARDKLVAEIGEQLAELERLRRKIDHVAELASRADDNFPTDTGDPWGAHENIQAILDTLERGVQEKTSDEGAPLVSIPQEAHDQIVKFYGMIPHDSYIREIFQSPNAAMVNRRDPKKRAIIWKGQYAGGVTSRRVLTILEVYRYDHTTREGDEA